MHAHSEISIRFHSKNFSLGFRDKRRQKDKLNSQCIICLQDNYEIPTIFNAFSLLPRYIATIFLYICFYVLYFSRNQASYVNTWDRICDSVLLQLNISISYCIQICQATCSSMSQPTQVNDKLFLKHTSLLANISSF